jgi:hypothetical protein
MLMSYDEKLPLWHKAVLNAQEAAEYSDLNVTIIRAHAALAMLGKSDFPGFFVGNHLKVHRELFIEWLADIARTHEKFETRLVKQIVQEATKPVMRGRPRKQRLTSKI